MKMKLHLKARCNYGQTVLVSNCPEADALFDLMAPRKHFFTHELNKLYKAGYEIEIGGPDVKDAMLEMQREDIPMVNKFLESGKLEYKGGNS